MKTSLENAIDAAIGELVHEKEEIEEKIGDLEDKENRTTSQNERLELLEEYAGYLESAIDALNDVKENENA